MVRFKPRCLKILSEAHRKLLASKYSVIGMIAVLIAVVLLGAAMGKFFHPSKYLKTIDQWVSGFEILFLILILFFRKQTPLWVGAAFLFALWAGYALFWYCVHLPCGCMGAKLNIPTAFTLTIDVLFVLASLFILYLLEMQKMVLFLCATLCGFFALGGFAIGEWVFKHYVTS